MGFTEEEIKSGKINVFDHLKNPKDIATLTTIMRLLETVPMIEQNLVDMYIELLDDKNLFKRLIKKKLNETLNRLELINKEVLKEVNHSNDRSAEVTEEYQFGLCDLADKFTASMIDYCERLEVLTNVSELYIDEERDQYLFSKIQILANLPKGATFFFMDNPNAVEYTYCGVKQIEDDWKAVYKKVNVKLSNDEIEFVESNMLRPVISTELLSKKDLEELFNKLKH